MQNLENPFFDKIVIPQKEIHHEEQFHTYVIDDVYSLGGKQIEKFEIHKTSKDLMIINLVTEHADRILREHGRAKEIQIPNENIHLMKTGGVEEFTEGLLSEGGHATALRSVLIDRCESDFQFATVLFHELMHLKCYTALQLTSSPDEPKLTDYRSGISVTSRDGNTIYLKNVEEAVIGYLTSQFVESIRNSTSILSRERKNENIKIGREEELADLNSTVNEIYVRNLDIFESREEVFNAFIDGQVNGNLFKIAKVIENTFGKGTMKRIDFQKIND